MFNVNLKLLIIRLGCAIAEGRLMMVVGYLLQEYFFRCTASNLPQTFNFFHKISLRCEWHDRQLWSSQQQHNSSNNTTTTTNASWNTLC